LRKDMAANAGKIDFFLFQLKTILALGILRNSENIPKVWKELDVDPKRYVNMREYRDRTKAFQSASALHLPQLYLKSTRKAE
jgi:hypothetical protein